MLVGWFWTKKFELWLFFIMWVVGLLFILITQISASQVCTCECCVGTECLSQDNGTFAIDACDLCKRDLCVASFLVCRQADAYVKATCLSMFFFTFTTWIIHRLKDRDGIWNQIVVFAFLGVVGMMVVVGLLKSRIEFVVHKLRNRRVSICFVLWLLILFRLGGENKFKEERSITFIYLWTIVELQMRFPQCISNDYPSIQKANSNWVEWCTCSVIVVKR